MMIVPRSQFGGASVECRQPVEGVDPCALHRVLDQIGPPKAADADPVESLVMPSHEDGEAERVSIADRGEDIGVGGVGGITLGCGWSGQG